MSEQAGSIYYSVDIETSKTLTAQKKLGAGFDQMQGGMDKTDQAAKNLTGGLSKLAGAIATVIAANALRSMAELVQNYQEMSERVKMATASQEEFEMVQRRLLASANATYRSLGEAQELYIRTADSLRSMGYSTEQALDVTDSMALSFVKNATSADRANAAISALSKSVNTGKVAADQWETITSAIPSVIDDIATASGKTSAEIRKLGATGKLTAQQLTEGLRKSLDANAQAAAGMSNNLRDAAVRSETALTAVLVAIEEQTGGLQTLTNGIIAAADAMLEFGQDSEKMAAFLNSLTTAATAVAAVIAGRLLQSFGAYAIAQTTAISATMARIAADQAAVAGSLRRATVEKASALAALAVARAEFEAAKGTNAHAIAANALVAAQTRAAQASGVYAAAQNAANTVATRGAIVMGVLNKAMFLLGGPVGVILLAATALYTFGTSAKDAKPPVDLLAKAVNDLGDAALRLNKIEVAEKLEELKGLGASASNSAASIESLKKQLKEFPNSANAEAWARELANQENAAEAAGTEIETYKKRLQEINAELGRRKSGAPLASEEPTLAGPAATSSGGGGQSEAERAAESIRDQVAALQFQADTLDIVGSELEIYKLQLAGATDEQIRAAQSSLSLIDAFNMQADAEKKIQQQREAFGTTDQSITQTITGQVDPLSGGAFDDQAARYEAEAEAENLRYASQLERLNEAKALQLEVTGGYYQLEEDMAQSHADRIAQIEQAKSSVMLQTAASGFDSMASLAGQFAGEQSGIYKVMFAASKAFAIADAAIKIQQGIAAAAALPFPANLGAMATVAAATSSIVSSISSVAMSGKALGGPVQSDQMYRVNETGSPEIFNAANGRQYMMPNTRGEVVSNKDAQGGGSGGVTVNVTLIEDKSKAGQVEQKREGSSEMITAFVADIRGGGPASRAIEQTYGTSRVGQ
jgi:tape measure domain-containing protein